jgi:hypothetical protein
VKDARGSVVGAAYTKAARRRGNETKLWLQTHHQISNYIAKAFRF